MTRRRTTTPPRQKAKPKRSLTSADSDALRRLAVAQRHPRLAKRLRAMVHLADGLGLLAAAVRERVSEATVRVWRALYIRGGAEALLRIPTGRRAWLNAEQSAALAAIIRERPEISYGDLRAVVKEKFGVAYTERSLEAYVARQLGFMRHDGRFWGGPRD